MSLPARCSARLDTFAGESREIDRRRSDAWRTLRGIENSFSVVVVTALLFGKNRDQTSFFAHRSAMASTKEDMDRVGLFKEMEYVTIKDPYVDPSKGRSFPW